MKRSFVVLVAVGITVGGCGTSGNGAEGKPSPSDSSAVPSESEGVSSAEGGPTTASATEPAKPGTIDETLVPSSDDIDTRQLLTGVDPSPIDGDAIPPRPDAHCAIASNEGWGSRLEAVGCEFESPAAASAYMQQWSDAIANPKPQWHLQDAVTAPVSELPDWSGRAISANAAHYSDTDPVSRVDLVQQRGPRVYVVTAVDGEGNVKAATDAAVELATAQQRKLDDMNVADDTPAGDVSTVPDQLSVRYLTPTWQELQALAPNMIGPPEEQIFTGRADSSYDIDESYLRAVKSTEVDESGYLGRFEVEITRHTDSGAAIRTALDSTGMRCAQLAEPIEGVPNGVMCSTGYDTKLAASHGPFALTMEVPNEVDANAAQQLFVQWNQRVLDLGLPADAPVPARDALPRTGDPLPTDSFPTSGYDGSYQRVGVGSSVEEGRYVFAYSRYNRTPEIIGPPYQDDRYSVEIDRSDNEIYQVTQDGELLGSPGEITADSWTTVTWRTYGDADSTSYESAMFRLLPSGDRLAVRDADMFIIGPAGQPDPPFAVDGPLLSSVWESLQDYSLDDFQAPDVDVIEVRDFVGSLEFAAELWATDAVIEVEGDVVDDSPPGTNAEWRSTLQIRPRDNQPEARRQFVAFENDNAASQYFTSSTNGVELTPFAFAPDVEGGFNPDAGLIALRRGKWVLTMSSPGRTDWQTGNSPGPINIEQFASDFARRFMSTGLT